MLIKHLITPLRCLSHQQIIQNAPKAGNKSIYCKVRLKSTLAPRRSISQVPHIHATVT